MVSLIHSLWPRLKLSLKSLSLRPRQVICIRCYNYMYEEEYWYKNKYINCNFIMNYTCSCIIDVFIIEPANIQSVITLSISVVSQISIEVIINL